MNKHISFVLVGFNAVAQTLCDKIGRLGGGGQNRILLPLAMLAMMSFAGSLMAQPTTHYLHPDNNSTDGVIVNNLGVTDTGKTGGTMRTIFSSIELSAGTDIPGNKRVRWYDNISGPNWVEIGAGAAGDTFDFGRGLSITLDLGNTLGNSNQGRYTAIFSDLTDGTFDLGASTIKVTGGFTANDNGNLYGFYSAGNAAFTGKINGENTNIEVIATNGQAFGVFFITTYALEGAEITFGNITAEHKGQHGAEVGEPHALGATAFRAGELKTNTQVNLGHIQASTSEDTFAIGVHINSIDSTSSITIDQITANSARSAGGLLVGASADSPPTTLGNSAGSIAVGDINVTGVGNSYGIMAGNMAQLDLTGGVNVTSTAGQAYGTQIWGNITDDVNAVGKITATGGNTGSAGAAGFAVYGDVSTGKTIILGDIEAQGGWAVGAHFKGSVIGDVDIGDVLVIAGANEANGVNLQGTNNMGNVTVGGITASSTGANAFGIQADKASNLTLKGDIIAEGLGNDTSGIRGHAGIAITLDNNVNIFSLYTGSGTWYGADIWTTDGDLDINLNGRNLTTGSVKVDSNKNLTMTGNSYADLGKATVTGKTTIGNGTDKTIVALDLSQSSLGGTLNEIKNNATLVGYGESTDITKKFTFTAPGNFINEAVFTNWGWNGNDIQNLGLRDNAYMSDGFLAAFGIHNRYAAWNVVREHIISGNGRGNPYANRRYDYGYYGQAPCDPCAPVDPCAPCDPCTPCGYCGFNDGGPRAWVNYIGRSDAYESSYSKNRDWELTMDGVQAGTDLFRSQYEQFGILFGYETGTMTNVADRINADDTYAGVYASKVFRGGADLRGVYAYGWQEYDMRRVNGGNLYTSSFKGRTSEAHLELGKRLSPGPMSLRPVIAVDVLSSTIEGATESGDPLGAVRFDKTSYTQVFLRTGSELRYRMDFFTFNGGLFYSYDVNGDTPSTRVTLIGDPSLWARLRGPQFGRSLLTFHAGGACQITDRFSVFGGYQGEYAFDRNNGVQNTAYFGGAWAW